MGKRPSQLIKSISIRRYLISFPFFIYLSGCTVIGIAGGEDKCAWLRSLGFDVALNYKSENFQAEFRNVTPKLVDVFFDNVGGDILDMVLRRINQNARIVLCGAISQYNATQPKGPAYYSALITQR